MTAVRKWDGHPISEPGVYSGVPMDVYHGQLTVGPSISSSGLRTIDGESPAHFFDASYLNPDRAPDEDKPHFTLGSAVHTLLMRESGFAERFIVRPAQWTDWRKAEARDWRDAVISEGLGVLTQVDLEVIKGIARQMAADPFVRDGGFDGLAEHSIVWRDPETGVWLKARPDVWNVTARVVTDLKTISSADGISCRKAIGEHSYHVQLGLIAEGIEVLTGEKVDDGCVLAFAEKKRPYCVNIKPVDPQAVWIGRQIVRRAVRKFAECLERQEWSGYEDSGRVAHLPAWLEKRMDDDAKAGLLPDPLHIEPRKEAAE